MCVHICTRRYDHFLMIEIWAKLKRLLGIMHDGWYMCINRAQNMGKKKKKKDVLFVSL